MTVLKQKNKALVYSTDTAKNQKCLKCKKINAQCTCQLEVSTNKNSITAILRIEKSGRKGKTVTVIDKLPKNEDFLKNLSALLKNKCGAGGTYSLDGISGIVEIQGNKLELIKQLLLEEGIRSK